MECTRPADVLDMEAVGGGGDPRATGAEKAIAVSGAALSIVAPGGGYGTAGKASTTLVQANRTRGIAAEAKIAARFPGAGTQVSKNTTQGTRVIDVLTKEGTAIESKVGRTSLTTKGTREQIAKDVELMKDPASGVKSVEWHFSRSDKTGKVGPTAPLREALDKAGIKVVIE